MTGGTVLVYRYTKTDNDGRHGFGIAVTVVPPHKLVVPMTFIACTGGIHVPDNQVAQMVGHLRIGPSLAAGDESAGATVYQRGARLRCVCLVAGIVSPLHVPDYRTHAGFGDAASVVLSGIVHPFRQLSGLRNAVAAAMVVHLSYKDA